MLSPCDLAAVENLIASAALYHRRIALSTGYFPFSAWYSRLAPQPIRADFDDNGIMLGIMNGRTAFSPEASSWLRSIKGCHEVAPSGVSRCRSRARKSLISDTPRFASGEDLRTVPPDGKSLHVFVSEDEREIALALEPKFLEKLEWGRKVVGLRVLLAAAKPKVVTKLLAQAWSRKAPKSLRAATAAAPGWVGE
jgi:hypothetical protein